MSIQNSNFQQENVTSNEYNPSQQKEYSRRNSQLKKISIQKEQTPIQLSRKKENQMIAQIQVQENVANQFYISKRKRTKSPSQEIKQTNYRLQIYYFSYQINFIQNLNYYNQIEKLKKYYLQLQPNITQQEEQQQQIIHQQVRKNSQLKIQPVFSVNIQITQYNPNDNVNEQILTPQNAMQQIRDRIKKEQNELKPIQLIQSNIFQSQSREIVNRRSTNQQRVSEYNQENSDRSYYEKKLSSYEIKMGVKEDPMLKDKQDVLSDIHEILKQLTIKSTNKRHSILEDSFQFKMSIIFLQFLILNSNILQILKCLFETIPDIRLSEHQIHSSAFYEEIKLRYKLERSFSAFKRRFYHLQIFSDCWTIQNLQKMYQIIKNFQEIQLDSYHINYSIINKSIDFPDQIFKKKSPEKPKVVQKIIENSQNKKIVLSLTTKTLCQYVNLTAKEIDEDIQEFDDELKFIDMILKLIPLAL